jgi:hypothetical protein
MSRNKYFPGTLVSRYLNPDGTGYSNVVYQKGKLVLDSELLLNQSLQDLQRDRFLARQIPSGFIRGQARGDSYNDFSFDQPWLPGPVLNPSFTPNSFHMRKIQALVAGLLVDVDYTNTNTPGDNLILLNAPTVYDGTPLTAKRTDFVFLEVWLSLISASPRSKGTFLVKDPVTATAGIVINVDGVALTGVLIPPGPNQFQIFPASASSTASSLATAINTFVPTVTANPVGNIVQMTAVTPGVIGNTILISSTQPAAIVRSNATLSGGLDTPNKPTQDSVYRNGNVLSSSSVALPDDIEDPDVGVETTKRIQVQYRIRTTTSITNLNFKTEADGFSNINILAQGPNTTPIVNYPFVPADLSSFRLNSDARENTGYGLLDNGLYIAGNGSSTSASDLNTLDGFIYAIPIGFVFRRNDAYNGGAGTGFDPENNTNGGLTYNHGPFANPYVYGLVNPGFSDRPDGAFADAINENDILDLRRTVKPNGVDLAAELQYQIQALQDGNYRTWAIDTASKQQLGNGSGDVSPRNLVCNEVGRLAAQGGNPPLSGTTTRGGTVRNFDHFARRFGDQPVVERVVLEFRPTDTIGANPGKYVSRPLYALGFNGWAEGDTLTLDLSNLNVTTIGDFDPAGATVPVGYFDFYAPPGTIITDVLSAYHDDGNFNAAVDQKVQIATVVGIGTTVLQVGLDVNPNQVTGGLPLPAHDMVGTSGTGDVGSTRRIFLEVEVTYPLGEGLTDTPDWEIEPDAAPYPYGPMLENDVPFGSSQRPTDMERPLAPSFRQGFREVMTEYVANDPTGGGNPGVPIGTLTPETVVSIDPLTVRAPRRVYGDMSTTVAITDLNDALPRSTDDPNTDYGASTRIVRLENTGIAPAVPLSGAGQTLVNIQYFAQDAIPNYGAPGLGYQQSFYFRTNAPQTAGVKEGTISVPGNAVFPYTGTDPLPTPLLVEPLYVSEQVWTGQVGMGSVELPFPYFAPLDQIPVNDGRTEIPPAPTTFPGEWYFAATANVSIADFDAQVGTLALQQLVPADGSTLWNIGGVLTTEVPFKDTEFRVVFPFINRDDARPTAMAQPMSNVIRHKVFVPCLVRALQDSALFRKDEVLLVVLTRWGELDDENVIKFTDSGNHSGAAVFRTKNLLLIAGNRE